MMARTSLSTSAMVAAVAAVVLPLLTETTARAAVDPPVAGSPRSSRASTDTAASGNTGEAGDDRSSGNGGEETSPIDAGSGRTSSNEGDETSSTAGGDERSSSDMQDAQNSGHARDVPSSESLSRCAPRVRVESSPVLRKRLERGLDAAGILIGGPSDDACQALVIAVRALRDGYEITRLEGAEGQKARRSVVVTDLSFVIVIASTWAETAVHASVAPLPSGGDPKEEVDRETDVRSKKWPKPTSRHDASASLAKDDPAARVVTPNEALLVADADADGSVSDTIESDSDRTVSTASRAALTLGANVEIGAGADGSRWWGVAAVVEPPIAAIDPFLPTVTLRASTAGAHSSSAARTPVARTSLEALVGLEARFVAGAFEIVPGLGAGLAWVESRRKDTGPRLCDGTTGCEPGLAPYVIDSFVARRMTPSGEARLHIGFVTTNVRLGLLVSTVGRLRGSGPLIPRYAENLDRGNRDKFALDPEPVFIVRAGLGLAWRIP